MTCKIFETNNSTFILLIDFNVTFYKCLLFNFLADEKMSVREKGETFIIRSAPPFCKIPAPELNKK